MSSGKAHPLARTPDLQLPFSQADDFEIRVNGPLVGLLIMHALNGEDGTEQWSPMRVWNWQTGQLIFVSEIHMALPIAHSRRSISQEDEQEYVCSFVWLSDKYILLAHMIPPEDNGALTVIELTGKLRSTISLLHPDSTRDHLDRR